MHIEIVEAQWLDKHDTVTLDELAELSGVAEITLSAMVAHRILLPLDESTPPVFTASSIVAARQAKRLLDQFELDLYSLGLVMTLLNRIHDVEAELDELRAATSGDRLPT